MLSTDWEHEIMKMRKWCTKTRGKNNKRAHTYSTKLTTLDDDVKKGLIKLYLQGCRYYHTLLYYVWRKRQLAIRGSKSPNI